MKVLVFNIGWWGQLGWMLNEALEARGRSAPEPDDVEYIDNYSANDPAKIAERGVSQLKKPGWSSITDSFVVDYGGQVSHVIVFDD